MTDYPANDVNRGSWRLRVYPLAVLVAIVGALVLATATYDRDHPTSRLGGDYPAFYAAGSIVADGDWDELYSDRRQQAEQAGLIDDDGGFLYFSYPPFVAGAYGLLGSFDYRLSFLVHTALMAAALVGAVKLLWPWLERTGWPQVAVVAGALAFYPMLRAVPGGQNTSLSLLLLAAAVRWDHEDRPVLAGLALALLLFKPQFGVVLVPLLLLSRRWRVLGGWAAGAVALYATSAALTSGDWVGEWWDQATGFSDQNVAANGANFVSLPGFFENLVGSNAAVITGYVLAAVLGIAVAYFWWKHPRNHSLERYALAGAAVAIAAPQTLFYDSGLLLLAAVAVLPLIKDHLAWWLLGGIALTWLQPLSGYLGWSPLGPLAWLVAAMIAWRLIDTTEPTPV